MKILVTGNYDTAYNRTIILLKGLKQQNDIEIIEYPFRKIKDIDKKYIMKISEGIDFIYLPPFTHGSVNIIKKIIQGVPIIFDPLISKYLTKVTDYKLVWKYSPRALKNYFKDKIPLNNCDIIITDTEEHKKYFSKKFNVSLKKMSVLPIGVDTSVFFPENISKNSKYFEVGFYGGFIPLQGVKKIVETAYYLRKEEEIRFKLIGSGFETNMIQEYVKKLNIKNIDFLGLVEYYNLPSLINSFDLTLGIFGDTPKANMVIPNKIFHYAAVRKCIITKDTPAIKEIFTDQKNIILSSNHPEEIGEKILTLKRNPDQMNRIANGAYELISKNYNENKIAEKFLSYILSYKPQ